MFSVKIDNKISGLLLLHPSYIGAIEKRMRESE